MHFSAMRKRALAGFVVVWMALPLAAAVKTEQKTKVDFPGMLGGMVRFFGGKAAKEGVVSSTALRGNRLLTITDQQGQLIDLDEEKIYEIEFNKKRYKVTTFAEYRQRIEEAQRKMAEATQGGQKEPSGDPSKEMEIDFDVKKTGQRMALNGQDCRQLVMTVTMREKGKTLDQGGGMVLNADMWMGPDIPEMKEVAEFHLRFMEKIGLLSMGADSAAQMAMMQKMYPMVGEAMKKFQSESADMSGTAMLTVMKIEVPSPEQRAQVDQQPAKEDDSVPTSIGGLLGGFGRKMGKKSAPEKDASPDGRSTLMTTTSEILSISTNVADGDVAIPANFKERN
ncbi:MAG: hypothetical protein WD733_12015 [Bryobacterales bacterium]